MITKSELALILVALVAFALGGLAEAALSRISGQARGMFGRAASALRNIAKRVIAWRELGGWIVKNFDRYAPVLATRTGAAALVQKIAGLSALLLPWLPITSDQTEIAVSVIILAVMLASFLRTLYGRRHASGEVPEKTTDHVEGPRPSAEIEGR